MPSRLLTPRKDHTANAVYAGSGNAAVDDLAATDVLTLDFIRKVRLTLVEQGAQPLIGPDGSERFGMIVHSRNAYQLKGDPPSSRHSARRMSAVPGTRCGVAAWASSTALRCSSRPRCRPPRTPAASPTRSASLSAQRPSSRPSEADSKFVDESFDYQAEQGYSFQCSFHPRRGLEQNSVRVLVAAPSVS